ncbi:purine nucleoside permease [Halosolutus gelatinilyticus]|uniref:purine nucleoside permease n=1 Tax=Halosolutus gelatinilyticus TaxID=2931975 RepID=UPI001FF32CDA|nr:purine nucleoside permease [Halosolutus gelatinilyticus]
MSASDRTPPEPRVPDPDDPVRPSALVLPAVDDPPLNELEPWLDRREIVDAVAVPGTATSLYLTAEGIAVTTTGIGKSDAAATVTALLAAPAIDLESAYVVSAGIAGAATTTAALGSVVVADAIVDWDRKHRWDRQGETPDIAEGKSERDRPIDLLNYRPRDYVWRLDESLVERAIAAGRDVVLREDPATREYQGRYPDAPESGPTVETGTTVCGDEFWHGPRYAREVEWLCEQYGVGPYATTQMEDAATATALERFGLLDRYLSVRAIANYDRSSPGETVEESFDGSEASLALAIDNAERVGSAIVEDLVATDPLGIGAEGTNPTS